MKGTGDCERAFWFLRCEVWFLSPWAAVKRALGLLQRLAEWWNDPPASTDEATLRWLYAEALSVLTLNVVTVIEPALHLDPREWRTTVLTHLTEGTVPMHQMRKLSTSIDEFLAQVMVELKAPAAMQVEAMGAFLPRPPEYADPLVELTSRLAQTPSLAQFPRHVDLLVHERLVHRRHPDPVAVARVTGGVDDEFRRARRLLAAFLRGHASLPDVIDRALVAETAPAATHEDSTRPHKER